MYVATKFSVNVVIPLSKCYVAGFWGSDICGMERRLAEQVATIWWVAVTTITITITTFTNITITIIMVFITLVVVVLCISPEWVLKCALEWFANFIIWYIVPVPNVEQEHKKNWDFPPELPSSPSRGDDIWRRGHFRDGGGDTRAGGDNLVGGGDTHHCHQLPSDRFSTPPIIGGDQASYTMLRSVKLSSLKHFSSPLIIGGDQTFFF